MAGVDDKRLTLPWYDTDKSPTTPNRTKHPSRAAIRAHEQITDPDVLNPLQRTVKHEDQLAHGVTTCRRFHQEDAALFQRFCHRPRHLDLRCPRLKPGHGAADRPAWGQQ